MDPFALALVFVSLHSRRPAAGSTRDGGLGVLGAAWLSLDEPMALRVPYARPYASRDASTKAAWLVILLAEATFPRAGDSSRHTVFPYLGRLGPGSHAAPLDWLARCSSAGHAWPAAGRLQHWS